MSSKRKKSKKKKKRDRDKEEKNAVPDMIVGPVIGKVTDTTARILVELNIDATITCILKPSKSDEEKEEKRLDLDIKAVVPGVFKFDHLKSKTIYTVSFEGIGNHDVVPEGRFRTTSKKAKKFRLIAAACDYGKTRRGPMNLFERIQSEFLDEKNIDLLLHHGDQVYADSAFVESQSVLKDSSLGEQERTDEMIECYKRIYRATWSEPDVRQLMASVQNLMLWDDHEIRNDWGTMEGDDDPETDDYKIALAARTAYWHYQRALWDDVEQWSDEHGPDTEGSVHVYGKFGILMVDGRACRTFSRKKDDKRPFIGEHQWNMIKHSLENELADVQALVVVHSMPPVFFGKCAACCLGCITPQKDKIGFALYPDEQHDYLELLDKWASKKDKGRTILMVGGDFHIATVSKIIDKSGRNNRVMFKELVTSGVSNKQPPCPLYCLYRCFLCCGSSVAGGYKVVHDEWTYTRNFGYIEMHAKDGESRIETTILSDQNYNNDASVEMEQGGVEDCQCD